MLAYRADEVPVGDDQRQHVELMRDIAERFNARFGRDPGRAGASDPGGRGADHGPPGPDQPDVDDRRHRAGDRLHPRRRRRGAKKVRSAVTDSGSEVRAAPRQGGDHEPDRDPLGDPRRRPRARSRREFDGSGYGDFKGAVAEAVVDYLAPVRERYAELRADEAELEAILAAGAEKARAIARRDRSPMSATRWASARA